jgi:hypothetical protein
VTLRIRRRAGALSRSTFALAMTIGLVACGAGGASGGPDTGIFGTVTTGPQCPVVSASSPCPDLPFSGKVSVSRLGQGVLTEAVVDAGGMYRIALEPGTYVVAPVLNPADAPPTSAPKTVLVRPGSFTRADLTVDTGIR